ncbi:MAG: lipopolysaccharide biosynthesis protein, partial [Gemmatimonadetes bacterium]|nr:lipopolysaccharide biosynthesis protein [Gemmatimonadota bacterium]
VPLVSLVFLLGLEVAYMRGAAATRDADLRTRQRTFSMSFGTIAAVGAVGVGLGWVAAPWLAELVKLPVYAVRYILAIVYTDALLTVPYAQLRMSNQAKRYATLKLLFAGLSVVLNVVLIGRLGWDVSAIFFSNLVANAAVLLLMLPIILHLFRPATLRGAEWGPLWRYALPLIPAALAVALVENGDRMVLNALPDATARAVYGMDTKDVVGIYSFNYKLGVAMLLVVQMFRMAWTPFSLTQAKQPGAPQLFSRVLTALMLGCSGVFLAVTLFLPVLVQIPSVYNFPRTPAYWLGLSIVPVILLGYVFSGVYAVVTAGLYVERRTSVLPWISGAGAAINLLICAVAARYGGMVAVAWATPASYGLMAALGARAANRVFPVPFEWLRLAHLGAIATAIFAADHWLLPRAIEPGTLASAGVKLLLLLAFPALLVATRFFRAGERAVMRRLVPGRRSTGAA